MFYEMSGFVLSKSMRNHQSRESHENENVIVCNIMKVLVEMHLEVKCI